MTPASRLPVEEGDVVLDLCAAPGGKATELGAKLHGTGLLIANDISSKRAKALLKNIELFGVENSFIVTEYPAKLVEYFTGFFDKILIDAPCSGEGMFRKDPAMVKAWEQNGPEFYAKLQREILEQALPMLKEGGMLLYSTCTFSPLEDEGSVQYLLFVGSFSETGMTWKDIPDLSKEIPRGSTVETRNWKNVSECFRISWMAKDIFLPFCKREKRRQ